LKNDFLGMKYPCLDFPTIEALLVYENRLNFLKNNLEVERVIFIKKKGFTCVPNLFFIGQAHAHVYNLYFFNFFV
jgi:hypothetical protein